MPQKQKKGKRPDRRPARQRYWLRGSLKKNKVRRLVRSGQFKTAREAEVFWLNVRTTRIKKAGFTLKLADV